MWESPFGDSFSDFMLLLFVLVYCMFDDSIELFVVLV